MELSGVIKNLPLHEAGAGEGLPFFRELVNLKLEFGEHGLPKQCGPDVVYFPIEDEGLHFGIVPHRPLIQPYI
jgi:hypothetical protein